MSIGRCIGVGGRNRPSILILPAAIDVDRTPWSDPPAVGIV